MANEISAQARLNITKNGTSATGNKTTTLTLAGSVYKSEVQTIGSGAAELVNIGDASDLRYLYLYNGTTHTCTATMSAIVLKPGDVCMFPPATSSVSLQATASADIDTVLTEA